MRSAASIFLLVILVPATVVVLLVSSLRYNVATPQFLKRELARRNAYGIVEDQASKQIGKMQFENLAINAADLQTLIRRVLPASWLQQNVETILDRSFAWFNGPSNMTLSLPIDLTGPKAELIPGVDGLIASALPRLPACARFSHEGELCRTPGMTLAQVKDMLKQGGIDLATITTQLPDTIDLANPVLPEIKLGNNDQSSSQTQTSQQPKEQKKPDEESKTDAPQQEETLQQRVSKAVDQLAEAKKQYHRGLQVWTYAVIAYGVLILGFLLINLKGWKRLLRWAGILLLTIGVLPLAIGVASSMMLEKYILPMIHFNADTAVEVSSAAVAAIRDVRYAFLFPVLIAGAILALFGIGAIIGAHWVTPAAKKKS